MVLIRRSKMHTVRAELTVCLHTCCKLYISVPSKRMICCSMYQDNIAPQTIEP